jgi:hypothetical protein
LTDALLTATDRRRDRESTLHHLVGEGLGEHLAPLLDATRESASSSRARDLAAPGRAHPARHSGGADPAARRRRFKTLASVSRIYDAHQGADRR